MARQASRGRLKALKSANEADRLSTFQRLNRKHRTPQQPLSAMRKPPPASNGRTRWKQPNGPILSDADYKKAESYSNVSDRCTFRSTPLAA
jgi:hypothetical protein